MNLSLQRTTIILSFLMLFACKKKTYLTHLNNQLIIDVLIDVHIANAFIDKQTIDNKDSLKEVYTSQIVDIHQLSRPTFDSIISYVHLDIHRYKTISNAVVDSVASIKGAVEKKNRAEKNR